MTSSQPHPHTPKHPNAGHEILRSRAWSWWRVTAGGLGRWARRRWWTIPKLPGWRPWRQGQGSGQGWQRLGTTGDRGGLQPLSRIWCVYMCVGVGADVDGDGVGEPYFRDGERECVRLLVSSDGFKVLDSNLHEPPPHRRPHPAPPTPPPTHTRFDPSPGAPPAAFTVPAGKGSFRGKGGGRSWGGGGRGGRGRLGGAARGRGNMNKVWVRESSMEEGLSCGR